MIQTTIRELKDGQFFTFRPHEYPKERQVYVRSRYDRSGKKFAYFPFSDMMDEHFAKGSRVVFTDFIFQPMELTQQDKETIVYALQCSIRNVKNLISRAKREGKPTGTYEYVLRKLRNAIDKFEI